MLTDDAVIFRERNGRFVLRTMPGEVIVAYGSLEACKAAGRLITGKHVLTASMFDEASMDIKLQTDHKIFR